MAENILLKDQLNDVQVTNMILNDQCNKLAEFFLSQGYSLEDLLKITAGVYSVN